MLQVSPILKLGPSEEVRFCSAWKLNEITNTSSLRSAAFYILGEQFYLQLNNKLNSTGTYEFVLHKQDPRGFSNKIFNISLLFVTTEGSFVRDNTSMVRVQKFPHILFSINSYQLSNNSATGSRRYNNQLCIPFIMCFFHGDFSSMFQAKTNDLSTCKDIDFPPNLQSLSLDFTNLLKNETLADVKLKCGDHTLSAHRSVLAARSEVFAAMFQTKMAESESGSINIIDMEASVIDLFLKYMYGGQISGVLDDVLPGLYTAADKYAVLALKDSCREQMIGKLSSDNYISFLILSDKHNDLNFKKTVIDFICSNEKILEEEAWMSFAEEPSKLAIEVYKKYVEHKRK